MIDVSDLIGIPYKAHGRDKNGMDCYGLVLEVCRRMEKPLFDVEYERNPVSLASEYEPLLNVQETDRYEEGVIITMRYWNELHMGVCLSENTFIHAARRGVRISRIGILPVIKKYKVL